MSRSLTVILLTMTVSLTGCAWMFEEPWGAQRSGSSTSLVEYLYPNGEIPPDPASRVPHLELPLRVGLSFVPPNGFDRHGPDEADRVQLLEEVRAQFTALEYVESITVIPDTYLRGATGVDGMQQVARLFDVDVMALISYDQVSRSLENTQSLLYWTIVGAYVIEGTDHQTRTFIDLAVIDVATSKMLLRAPGFSERRGDTTLVKRTSAMQRNRVRGMNDAADQLRMNLANELVAFEERLKREPEDIKVSWRQGSGGGSMSALGFLVLAGLLVLRRQVRQNMGIVAGG